MRTFSLLRLVAGVLVGSTCALVLSWLAAPELASRLALNQSYEGPASATHGLMAYDILFSFVSFFAGSLVSYAIARSQPYWACCTVGLIGWLVYFFEAGGIGGVLSGEYPFWYELAPTHIGSSLLAAWSIARRKREA